MMKQQMIMQKNIQQTKQKTLHGSMALVSLLVLLVLSLVFPSSSKSQTTELVTGQETTVNQLPTMENHTRSGGTKVNTGTGTSQGCQSGNFCTAGKQGPGGTYSSTFDLKTNMTIDQINRGFTMDYGMDVESHSSNSRLASCVGGNVMQNSDCRDIFKLTVKLFDTGNIEKHSFVHEVELDFTGTRNFSFSQIIPENNYTDLTGTWDMFGIDAGFANKFFGPAFSAPFLTTTFDLVTLIETEVIDIINTTDLITDNTPDDVQVQTIEVEVETQDGQQMASLELEVNTEMTMEMEIEMPSIDMPAPTQEVQVEVAEVSAEIETEMSNVADVEPTTDQPVESTESGTDNETQTSEGSESTTEGESTEQGGESTTDNESTGESESNGAPESTSSSEENQDAQSAEPQQKPKAKVKVAKPKKSAKQKAANKIVKKMGDKGRYDSTNQLKTLVIMNVLTDSKKFLVQPTIPQPTGFFTDTKMPDAQLPENNAAAWMLMGGSNQLHDRLTGLQYKEK